MGKIEQARDTDSRDGRSIWFCFIRRRWSFWNFDSLRFQLFQDDFNALIQLLIDAFEFQRRFLIHENVRLHAKTFDRPSGFIITCKLRAIDEATIDGFRFALEPIQTSGITRHFFRQNFEPNSPL